MNGQSVADHHPELQQIAHHRESKLHDGVALFVEVLLLVAAQKRKQVFGSPVAVDVAC
jgi:hypothetical protein